MKYKVKDVQFVKSGDDIVIDIIQKSSKEVGKSITRGLVNKDKITTDTEFDYAFTYDAGLEYQYVYVALKNEYGTFIVREDNTIQIPESQDILDEYGIKRLIRVGNKSILVGYDGSKAITTRDNFDKDDPEKALMVLLLKRDGYCIKDINEMASKYLKIKK